MIWIVTLSLFTFFVDETHFTIDLNFFSNFLFQSCYYLLLSYSLPTKIIKTEIFYKGRYLGLEKEILSKKQEFEENERPDFLLNGIEKLISDKATIDKLLACGGFGVAWKGKLNIEENEQVVFKQLINANEKANKEFIHEALMMAMLRKPYLLQLKGVTNISDSLIKSSENCI